MRSLVVLTAGLSEPSSTRQLAETIAEATEAKISARGEGVNTHIIEVRTLASELATAMTNWAAPTPQLDEAKELLSTADGFIAVTPAFQGSYSGLFKMFFDVLDAHALEELPTIVAATGGSPRHALILDYALRPPVELPARPRRSNRHIPGNRGSGHRRGRAHSQPYRARRNATC